MCFGGSQLVAFAVLTATNPLWLRLTAAALLMPGSLLLLLVSSHVETVVGNGSLEVVAVLVLLAVNACFWLVTYRWVTTRRSANNTHR